VKFKIKVDERTYEVDVEAVEPEAPERAPRGYVMEPAAIRMPAGAPAAPKSAGPEPADEAKVCRSPVTGTVVKLVAQPGQKIEAGDVLMVLEAMKMETNITAPMGGKVAAIRANAGDSVQAGQVLVEFE
jgi:methylmalonyl-CoA carboxyltransferase small subunit